MYGRFCGIDSYYSHAFLIPLVSGFVVWQKRQHLKGMSPEISWWGLVVIVFAVLMHVAGTILYVFSISGFSIFFFIIGSSLFLFGKRITSEIKFPLAFLIFMFPLPLAILTAISFPMKLMAAKAGVTIVSFLGVSVLREGFNISTSAGSLVIGNPCSGLRSLISFLALGAFFAYLTNTSNVKKFVLFALAIPVAILSNMARVPILILISYYWGLEAASPDSFLHDASGFLVFVIGFIMLFSISRTMEWKS